jgi:hypothetical protein
VQSGRTGSLEAMKIPFVVLDITASIRAGLFSGRSLLIPLALGLPAFAIAGSGISKLRPENNPARMLAVMSRTTNGIFIASRLPVRPDCTPMSNPRYLLYVPG